MRIGLSFLIVAGMGFALLVSACVPTTQSTSRTTRDVACYTCHKEAQTRFTTAPVIHAPVAQVDCMACHKNHGIMPALALKAPRERLCQPCHPAQAAASDTVHQPVREGRCTTCHDAHVSTAPHLIDPGKKCRTCHEQLTAQQTLASVHPWVADDKCQMCHQPHGDQSKHLLPVTGPAFCLKCHAMTPELRARHGGELASQGDCLTCHMPHASRNRKLLVNLHQPVTEAGCDACHAAGAPGRIVLQAEVKELCLTCHSEIETQMKKRQPHAPVREGKCTTCHAPHGSMQPSFLRQPVGELCAGCHQQAATGTAGNTVHQPVRERLCTKCHLVHGGDNEAMLRETGSRLCLTCHSDTAVLGGRYRHAPAVSDCRTCHESHQSSRPRLLKNEAPALCQPCHAAIKPDRTQHSHPPFVDGKCSYCHSPHSSPTEGLLTRPVRELCFSCHESDSFAGQVTHPPAAQGECATCHNAHQSREAGLLQRPLGELCTTCHSDLAEKLKDRDGHTPFRAGRCTDCHTPHAGNRQNLLVLKNTVPCQDCHESMFHYPTDSGVIHYPVASQACGTCHDVHASGRPGVLVAPEGRLCSSCHDLADQKLKTAHQSRVTAATRCTACHTPHYSLKQALISDKEHPPFAERSCEVCHSEPASDTSPLGLPADRVGICTTCHEEPAAWARKRVVHAPVKTDCTGCHNPHATVYSPFLNRSKGTLCLPCHDKIRVQSQGVSRHAPVADGQCIRCHQVHAADTERLLTAPVADGKLCFTCHGTLKAEMDSAPFTHPPAVGGECGMCHQVHGSAVSPLLSGPIGEVCAQCHEYGEAKFKLAHAQNDVSRANCVRCHEPHDSVTPHLLKRTVHYPVRQKMCNTCHVKPIVASDPVSVAPDVCFMCHNKYTQAANENRQQHGALATGNRCTNCHDPHASDLPHNLKQLPPQLCYTCHENVELKLATVTNQHPPVAQGECLSCHQPHYAAEPRLLTQGINTLCFKCHEMTATHMHPIGVAAPSGGTVTCRSCHTIHGSNSRGILIKDEPFVCAPCHAVAH